MQEYIDSNKIKENKYKILRMSLLLGSGIDREDTFNNFEDAAREIDAMNDEVYLKNIEDKFYDTLKLEEEEKKLSVLVDYIGGRVEQRISLLSDFANVTGYDLQNLPPIKYYDKLDDYKERLGYIREYLNNTEQINTLKSEIEKTDKKLNEAYLNRAASEEYNQKIENTLLNKFQIIFKSFDFFETVTEDNVEEKFNNIIYNVEDSKKSLDIFTKSFTTLSGSGISEEEEQEYFSYVENAKAVYYTYKEQEYVFRIYRLLLNKYTDYNQILYKREEINDILYERLKLRKELKIAGNDLFSNIYDLLERQYDDIKRQKNDIENIEKLTDIINQKREELNQLEIENQKVEILSLLREFCIIDTFDDIEPNINTEQAENSPTEDIIPNTDNIFDNNQEESAYLDNATNKNEETEVSTSPESEIIDVNEIINPSNIPEEILDNQVISIDDITGIDLELIQSKANKVMKRVGEMLGIKVEDTKIISVTDESIINQDKNIFINDNTNNEIPTTTDTIQTDNIEENPLFGNNNIENNNEIENPLFQETNLNNNPESNPLFTNEKSQSEITTFANPLFNESSSNNEINNDFWFQSDTPDALNELPDLEISNDNFFANNNIADLEFPDLNINFPNNNSNTEEKL